MELPQAKAHFLGTVMRLKTGSEIRVFNGEFGEWRAKITDIQKRRAAIEIVEQLRMPYIAPDIWLVFAPIKKARTDFIIEKATELGVRHIQPVITRRTTSPKIKLDRMQAQIVEAAEQTERLDLPSVGELTNLTALLNDWDERRALIFADEAGDAQAAVSVLQTVSTPAAILIGPEGGFDSEERAVLREKPFVTSISLGPRILRADTAVVATLALWQAVSGDWQ